MKVIPAYVAEAAESTYPLVYNTVLQAQTVAAKFSEPRVVVKIGFKYCVVKPEVARNLKLKVIK